MIKVDVLALTQRTPGIMDGFTRRLSSDGSGMWMEIFECNDYKVCITWSKDNEMIKCEVLISEDGDKVFEFPNKWP